MSRGIARSSFLIVLAACNLLFWVAVAAGVGLAVSREVDLGVETLIREKQATAVQAWQGVVSGAPRVTVAPTAKSTMTGMIAPESTAVEIGAVQTSVAQASASTATATASPTPVFTSSPSLTPQRQTTENLAPTRTPAPATPSDTATPVPTETRVSHLLLISDDSFGSLAQIGEEMSRSAAGRPVLIRYSEAMLNNEIAAMVDKDPDLPYRNVLVDLKRDQFLVTGDVMLLGFEFSTEIVGAVLVEHCRPHMEIQEISIAGVLTPGFVKDQAREMLVEALDWYPEEHPLCLEQIVLEEERATVYGHRR